MKLSTKIIIGLCVVAIAWISISYYSQRAQAGFLDDALTNIVEFIADTFPKILQPVLNALANFLPQAGADLPLRNTIAAIMSVGYGFAFVIPWQQIFTALSIVLATEFGLLVFKIATYMINLARG